VNDAASLPSATPRDDTGAPFEVLDALGWCRLQRRAADLDGSIPLRAARACVPLLEGNAYGWQLGWARRTTLRRRLGRWQLDDDALVRSARACVPYLAAHGMLHGEWPSLLGDGPVFTGRASGGAIAVWTGLLVRAGAAVLRIGDAGNRRNRDVLVDEVIVSERARWVPLVLELRPQGVTTFALGAEVATLASVSTDLDRGIGTLAEHPELGEAHLAFFDRAYFDEKRSGPTKKYRHLLAAPRNDGDARSTAIVAHAGPVAVGLEPAAREHDADGPRASSRFTRYVFRNLVGFTARDDGTTVHVEPDAPVLARVAGEIEAKWRPLLELGARDDHRGALWYLTKYFTPHVTGEPHFFVKPPALIATPPGWSLLVDGIHGDGYDVMRGVVRSDRFHAAPAVFAVDRRAAIEVRAGTPLARLVPFRHGEDVAAPRWHPSLPTAAQP
jgi:hypothetical protein